MDTVSLAFIQITSTLKIIRIVIKGTRYALFMTILIIFKVEVIWIKAKDTVSMIVF